MDDVKILKRGYHALNMLTMHCAGHFNLREDKYDEYVDTIVAILELANNEKHRLRAVPTFSPKTESE